MSNLSKDIPDIEVINCFVSIPNSLLLIKHYEYLSCLCLTEYSSFESKNKTLRECRTLSKYKGWKETLETKSGQILLGKRTRLRYIYVYTSTTYFFPFWRTKFLPHKWNTILCAPWIYATKHFLVALDIFLFGRHVAQSKITLRISSTPLSAKEVHWEKLQGQLYF